MIHFLWSDKSMQFIRNNLVGIISVHHGWNWYIFKKTVCFIHQVTRLKNWFICRRWLRLWFFCETERIVAYKDLTLFKSISEPLPPKPVAWKQRSFNGELFEFRSIFAIIIWVLHGFRIDNPNAHWNPSSGHFSLLLSLLQVSSLAGPAYLCWFSSPDSQGHILSAPQNRMHRRYQVVHLQTG